MSTALRITALLAVALVAGTNLVAQGSRSPILFWLDGLDLP
jgi:hypothetical protein